MKRNSIGTKQFWLSKSLEGGADAPTIRKDNTLEGFKIFHVLGKCREFPIENRPNQGAITVLKDLEEGLH